METPSPSDNRALIPIRPRSLLPFRRPLPVSQRAALGIAVGAVSTIFVKRLVELVAEDLYRRVRRGVRLPLRRVDSMPREEAEPPAVLEPGRTGVFFVQVVQVRRRLRLGNPHDGTLIP
jgi:hypothetical protein